MIEEIKKLRKIQDDIKKNKIIVIFDVFNYLPKEAINLWEDDYVFSVGNNKDKIIKFLDEWIDILKKRHNIKEESNEPIKKKVTLNNGIVIEGSEEIIDDVAKEMNKKMEENS